MKPADLPLHDIKPLLPIPDVSLYIFAALIVAALVTAAALGYYLYRKLRTRRRVDPRIRWLERLDRIDYDNPKEAAYLMTRYGRHLAEDQRRRQIFDQLLPRLEAYKYKKEVPPIDAETRRYMKLFIEMCHDAL